mmetsp:Transcript_25568/g.83570  ORF Transcript_25568/g.83570 Transcript_25568/m.83570 type:complete len:209 (+) Transcript_25568:78-704(+)
MRRAGRHLLQHLRVEVGADVGGGEDDVRVVLWLPRLHHDDDRRPAEQHVKWGRVAVRDLPRLEEVLGHVAGRLRHFRLRRHAGELPEGGEKSQPRDEQRRLRLVEIEGAAGGVVEHVLAGQQGDEGRCPASGAARAPRREGLRHCKAGEQACGVRLEESVLRLDLLELALERDERKPAASPIPMVSRRSGIRAGRMCSKETGRGAARR